MILERAEHRHVVLERGVHVQATDDMEFAREAVLRVIGFRHHLVERIAIRAFLFRQSRIRAEDTCLPQDAHVRGIDVLVGGECDAIAIPRSIGRVRKAAEPEQIRSAEEQRALVVGQPRATLHLVRNRQQQRIAKQRAIDRDEGRHQSPKRLIARDTLCPPNPKLFDSATRTSRLAILFGV